MKNLHSVDRARLLWHSGSILTLNTVALRQEMEKTDADQRQQSNIAVGCAIAGLHIPPVFNAVETVKLKVEGKGRCRSA